ncbi:MAG: nitroreductase/quinone reductase family protein [Acidimicrobiia bacterium]
MRLTTVGRPSGRDRNVVLGYFEDGPNLVTMAMNRWGVWWLNLQAHPDAEVRLVDGPRPVTGRADRGKERNTPHRAGAQAVFRVAKRSW